MGEIYNNPAEGIFQVKISGCGIVKKIWL